jgi:hypothetical protein
VAASSGGSIGQQDDAGAERRGVDENELWPRRVALEESPSVSEDRRMDEQPVLVDHPGCDQLPDDADAAGNADLAARPLLQRMNLRDQVAVEDDGVLPKRWRAAAAGSAADLTTGL